MDARALARRKKTPAEPSDQPAPPPLQPAYFDAEQAPGTAPDAGESDIAYAAPVLPAPEASGGSQRRARTPKHSPKRFVRRTSCESQAAPQPGPGSSTVAAVVVAAGADAVAVGASRQSLRPLPRRGERINSGAPESRADEEFSDAGEAEARSAGSPSSVARAEGPGSSRARRNVRRKAWWCWRSACPARARVRGSSGTT